MLFSPNLRSFILVITKATQLLGQVILTEMTKPACKQKNQDSTTYSKDPSQNVTKDLERQGQRGVNILPRNQ